MTKDVVVVAEHFRGQLNEITFELLGKGRELAGALGGKVKAVLLGHQMEGLPGQLAAADTVMVADAPELREFTADGYGMVLETWLRETSPRLVLLGSTSVGLDLLGLLSARAGFPCLDNCTRLQVQDGSIRATSQLYGGKIFVEVKVPEETTLVAVVPGALPAEPGKTAGRPEVQSLGIPASLAAARTKFRTLIEPPAGG